MGAARDIEVLAPGLLTTVQDGGRMGHAALGVGCAGAMDTVALRLANILVGNVHNAAALEITLRGPRLRIHKDVLIAITGAECEVRCEGVDVPAWRPIALRAGAELSFGGMRRGARSYLAAAGGIDLEALLGSRSSDVNSALGHAPLAAGDALAIGAHDATRTRALHHALRPASAALAAATWQLDPKPWLDAGSQPLRIIPGSHFPQLDNAAQHALGTQSFRIDPASNRVGYRLDGPLLALREPLELISEGVVPGTIQLPPGGAPIVLMAEAPTTGGYPRIAHVIGVDLPRLAQRRPGDSVRFVETTLDAAQAAYLHREQSLRQIARSVAERLSG
jgi:biotin-dependent carboxylase-like uncharacterized protein